MSGVPQAIQGLRDDHANMTFLLDVLEGEITRVRNGEMVDFEAVEAIVDYFLTYPDLVHHPKEDLLLHRLRARDPAAAAALEGMLSGHEKIAMLARRFARATVDHILRGNDETAAWFVSLGHDFIDMNRRHMAEEDRHFFPTVLRHLDRADWEAVEERIGGQDPLFGKAVEARFDGLQKALGRRGARPRRKA